MTLDLVKQRMKQLVDVLQRRELKYRRNFNRIYSNGYRKEDIHNLHGQPLGFYNVSDSEDGSILPVINVGRSCVNTLISKLSQAKTRPFFNPVVGDYETRKICREAQIYFDEYFDREKIYKKGIEALKNALVFDMGLLFADDEKGTVKSLSPWQFFCDPTEWSYGRLTCCMIYEKMYPLSLLKDKLSAGSRGAEKYRNAPWATCNYERFFDLLEKKVYEFVDGELIRERKIDYSVPPFAFIFYEEPIKGFFSLSLLDAVMPIQAEIDTLSQRIHTACELSPANQIFVPKGSDVKASMVSNEIGAVFEYMPGPAGVPVQVSTPRPIDPMYQQLMEAWEKKAFEMEGISMLSAQSKKPSGLNAAVALDTMQDIESERHNILLNAMISLYMDIAKVMIEVFPDNAELMPAKTGRAKITWKDIRKARDMFSIQFSAASSLSKDPKTKMEQIEKLMGLGVINPGMVSSLLELPDLNNAYSVMTASYDACQKIIQRAIEEEEYNFYEVVDVNQLYAETVNMLLRLDANDEDPETIKRVVMLLAKVKDKKDQIDQAGQPPAPPVPEPMPPQMPPPGVPI